MAQRQTEEAEAGFVSPVATKKKRSYNAKPKSKKLRDSAREIQFCATAAASPIESVNLSTPEKMGSEDSKLEQIQENAMLLSPGILAAL